MAKSIPVIVFLPVGVCSCSYVGFLSRIYDAMRKYSEYIDYYEDIAVSEKAKSYGIRTMGVVVGSRVLGPVATKEQIEEAICAELEQLGIEVPVEG